MLVDCEARGPSPVSGTMTEFGAVHYDTRDTFHGVLFESSPDPDKPAVPVVGRRLASDFEVATDLAEWLGERFGNDRVVLVSDNPAYDFMWIAGMFDNAALGNPFGHSGRRIGDFWAGMHGDWTQTQGWKKFRKTPHDHNPVNDALGNAEALEHILRVAGVAASGRLFRSDV